MVTCNCCHRGLKDPDSIERGMGPVCYKNQQAAKEDGQAQLIPPQWHGTIALDDIKDKLKKIYVFIRDPRGDRVTVKMGTRSYPLKHIIYHSPSGFAWGYGGSGPADTARSVLVDLVGFKVADTFYQHFKSSFLAGSCEPEFAVTGSSIIEWLKKMVTEQDQQEPQEAFPF